MTKNAFDLALCRYVSFEHKNGPTFDQFEHYQSNKVSGNISEISSGFDVKSLSENNEIVPSKKKMKPKINVKGNWYQKKETDQTQERKYSINIKGRYQATAAKQIAVFEIKLPDFCTSKNIAIRAIVEENVIGRHDIVFGRKFF